MKKYLAIGISIFIGIMFWIIVTNFTGESEAWDSLLYFIIGLPVLAVINVVLGAAFPIRPWRWGILSTFSQSIPMVLQSDGNWMFLPVTIIVFTTISIPIVLANNFGCYLRKKMLDATKEK